MAFDFTTLEGYREDMTAEEKIALLENYEPPAPVENPAPGKGYIAKTQFDKVSSELASAKKQLRSLMNEDQAKEADRQAAEEAMKNELAELRKEKALNEYKASYLSQGYNDDLATEAATAMIEGDMAGMFAAMKKFQSTSEKELRAKILKEAPVPPAGDDPNSEAKKKAEENAIRKSFGLPPLP